MTFLKMDFFYTILKDILRNDGLYNTFEDVVYYDIFMRFLRIYYAVFIIANYTGHF